MAKYKKLLTKTLLLLGALVIGGLIGSGCAIQRGDRSLVQPLALDKKQFEGSWYYQKTVTDTPYDATGVFIGSQSSGYKIRWEITENYLYAFTTQANVRNANSKVSPVAAWPIIGHFTIRYRISYSTGAPSNVISEDYADKPWHERPNFRVAWGRSSIADFMSSFWYYKFAGIVGAEWPTNVRPEQVRIQKDYMDLVVEEVLRPGIRSIVSKMNQQMPSTTFRVKFRHSFRKVKPSAYTPRQMNDDQFEKFGYFRTTIIQHHADRGLVDWSYKYYANRHNVATAAELQIYKDKKTPLEKQKPKEIVYYLSPNFPKDKDLRNTAYLIVQDWNKAFQRATGRKDDVIVLRENGHGLPEDQKRLNGDIRYRFLYWVKKPISFGLLGYGPSFADPDTGEIISSSAYIYGAVVRRVVSHFMLYYDMISGRYTDEDLRNGKDYLDIINNIAVGGTKKGNLTMVNGSPIKAAAYKGFSLKAADKYVHSSSFRIQNEKLKTVDRSAIQARFAMIDEHPSLKWAMMTDEMVQPFFPNTLASKLKRDDPEVQEVLNSYINPANMMRVTGIRQLEKEANLFSRHSMMLASYVDPALTKFVAANKHKSREKLQSLMTQMIFRGTEAHEIGHTLGLRHNFSASSDEKNYFDEYFDLKNKQGGNTPGEDKDPRHAWFYMYSSIMDYHGDRYGDAVGIGKYDHAAIMYAYGNIQEVNSKDNTSNLAQTTKRIQGRLDPYLAQIEKAFKDPKNTNYKSVTDQFKGVFKEIKIIKTPIKITKDIKGKLVYDTRQVLFHIQGIPAESKKPARDILKLTADDLSGYESLREINNRFGVAPKGVGRYASGEIAIRGLAELEESPLRRRFYKFCSDGLVGQDPLCNRFDSGVDPKQIVENMIRRYDGGYPLRNWSRGKRYYRLTGGYFYGLLGRFRTVSDFFQNWIWRVINERAFDGTPEYFNQLAAVQRGVRFLSRVVHTADPGRHIYDKTTDSWKLSTKDAKDQLNVPVGIGRYFYSKLQQDELGLAMYRFERIGTMYDKYVALMTLAIRDWGLANNSLNFFYVNFSDYFSKDDVTDLFIGAISGSFNKKFARTYKDKMIEPNWHPVLQYQSMFMAMTMLNSGFYGNTFSHYMTIGVKGSGKSWTPPKGSKVISFRNSAGTHTYFAVQTQDGRSISWKLISRGKRLSEEIKRLRSTQPTSAVNSGLLQEKEAELRWVETVIIMMRSYVSVFFE